MRIPMRPWRKPGGFIGTILPRTSSQGPRLGIWANSAAVMSFVSTVAMAAPLAFVHYTASLLFLLLLSCRHQRHVIDREHVRLHRFRMRAHFFAGHAMRSELEVVDA